MTRLSEKELRALARMARGGVYLDREGRGVLGGRGGDRPRHRDRAHDRRSASTSPPPRACRTSPAPGRAVLADGGAATRLRLRHPQRAQHALALLRAAAEDHEPAGTDAARADRVGRGRSGGAVALRSRALSRTAAR